MYSYESSKVRNKRIKKNKKYKLFRKTLAITGTIVVLVGSASAFLMGSGALEPEPQTIISEYYGEESKEYDVVSYIKLSEELEKLSLEKYEITPNLYDKYNISSVLKSPEEINDLITKIKNQNAFVSSKNITKQSENIDIVLNLVKQKELVNKYIYEKGYDLALRNIEQELNEYAGEVFGVDGENLGYYHRFDNKTGDNFTSIKNGDKRYSMGLFTNNVENNIRKGIITQDSTQDSYGKYSDSYDEQRNEDILKALKVSAQLSKENDETDLYNQKMASRLR